jgi:phosphoribosylformylglycinamidine cyclo-ligase
MFDWIAEAGRISPDEMRRTFNCGVGMIVVVGAEDADSAIASLIETGDNAWRMGRIAAGDGGVRYI